MIGPFRCRTAVITCGFALYLGLLFWVYRGLESSYFFRDDFMWLLDAEHQLAQPSKFLTWRPSGYFRPLSNIWFGLLHVLFGLDPRGYFAANVGLLAWIGVWLGLVVRSLGGSPKRALAAGLLVAFSVVVAPSVVWISGMVSLLCLACLLPALFYYQVHARTGRTLELWLSVLFVALAVCSREIGVLVGPLILGIELHINGVRTLLRRRTWLGLLPFIALACAYLAVQWSFFEHTLLAGRSGAIAWSTWPGNVLANVPALFQWGGPKTWLSAPLGGLLLACAGGSLLLLRGKRGAIEFGWLLALLLLAFLPTLTMFKGADGIAGRYRFEAAVVGCLFVAAIFNGLMEQRPKLLRALAVLILFAYLGAHALGTTIFVAENERFGKYAQESRKLAESIESHMGPHLRGEREGGIRFGIVGAPIENLRHLSSFLEVWYGVPKGAVESFRFNLSDPEVRASIIKGGSLGMVQLTRSDTLLYWGETGLETKPSLLMPLLKKDWRRPWKSARVAFVQVVEIPAL